MANVIKGLQLITYYQLVGLLPVFNVLRKTPANILSRNDVD